VGDAINLVAGVPKVFGQHVRQSLVVFNE